MFAATLLTKAEIEEQKLDPDTRALVEKAATEAQNFEWKWSEEQEGLAKKQCIEKGMAVIDLSDEPVWMEKARGIWPTFYDKVGGQALVDEAVTIIAKGQKK